MSQQYNVQFQLNFTHVFCNVFAFPLTPDFDEKNKKKNMKIAKTVFVVIIVGEKKKTRKQPRKLLCDIMT